MKNDFPELILVALVLPAFAVFVLNGVRFGILTRPERTRSRSAMPANPRTSSLTGFLSPLVCDFGYDLCVISVGASGGILAHPFVKERLHETSVATAFLVLSSVGLAVVITLLHRFVGRSWRVGLSGTFMGFFALSLPPIAVILA